MDAGSAIALYARRTEGFEVRKARALSVLQSAVEEHGQRLVQATSLGAEDMVVTDLIARHGLNIAVATLETGALHEQTLELLQRLQVHYGLTVEVFRPEPAAVQSFIEAHGPQAMYQSPALRKACCGIRKLEPLGRLMQGRSAWVTGLRREQSDARGEVQLRQADEQGRIKFSPLADWSWADVWHYIEQHSVPFNTLHNQFMPSIGCAPCTRAIAVGEPFRAGRWWWEDEAAKECGLHVKVEPAVSARGVG